MRWHLKPYTPRDMRAWHSFYTLLPRRMTGTDTIVAFERVERRVLRQVVAPPHMFTIYAYRLPEFVT